MIVADDPNNPHDMPGPPARQPRWGGVLLVLGEKELQKYLVNEIQEVYRLHPTAQSPRRGNPGCRA